MTIPILCSLFSLFCASPVSQPVTPVLTLTSGTHTSTLKLIPEPNNRNTYYTTVNWCAHTKEQTIDMTGYLHSDKTYEGITVVPMNLLGTYENGCYSKLIKWYRKNMRDYNQYELVATDNKGNSVSFIYEITQ